jgi:hypothetical protein
LARKLKIPRVVPGVYSSESLTKTTLLSALKAIETANPLLSVYVDWKRQVEANPSDEIFLV